VEWAVGEKERESGRNGEGRLARQRATLAVGASFLQNSHISSLAEWWPVDGAAGCCKDRHTCREVTVRGHWNNEYGASGTVEVSPSIASVRSNART
jgi:hypothetical protein